MARRQVPAWLLSACDRVLCLTTPAISNFYTGPMPTPERTASTDVRMRGFTQRVEVPAALAWIDAHTPLLPGESVHVDEATGRVLLQEVIAPIAVPEFNRAAMDGYALRGGETTGAGEYNPLEF